MNCICIGSANVEIAFSYTQLIPEKTDMNALRKLSGRKIEIEECEWRYDELSDGGRGIFSLRFKQKIGRRKGLTFTSQEGMRVGSGGSALSIAIGLRRGAGARVRFITTLDSCLEGDFFYEAIRGEMKRKGIELFTSIGRQRPVPYTILVHSMDTEDGSVVFMKKTPLHITKDAAKRALRALGKEEGVTHVVATGTREKEELLFVADAFRIVRGRNPAAMTYFMPSARLLAPSTTHIRHHLKNVFRYTSVWQMNEREAALYLGKRSIIVPDDVHRLAHLTGVPTILVTRGAKGACGVINGEYLSCPAGIFPHG